MTPTFHLAILLGTVACAATAAFLFPRRPSAAPGARPFPPASGPFDVPAGRAYAATRLTGFLRKAWLWLSDGSEVELAGHSALHSLAVERRRVKVEDARRAITEAWREYRRTMKHWGDE